MKTIFTNKSWLIALSLLVGLGLGWLLFRGGSSSTSSGKVAASAQATTYTCSMHPQIRMDKPGKCPICGMDLIPLGQSGGGDQIDPRAIHFTEEAAALADVQTTFVTTDHPVKDLRLYGKVQFDERLMQSQVSHLPGRIESLSVNFTGETVKKGQKLATLYSPELITAQQELLEAAKDKQHYPELYIAAVERLKQWKLTAEQIDQIERSKKVKNTFNIVSNTSGIVISRKISSGDYVSQGMVLYEIANLSSLWVMFDAYESDLPFIRVGDRISFSLQAVPGDKFHGTIKFIDPIIDATTRVAKVRVEVRNPRGVLKPEMFATGVIKANLNSYRDKIIIPSSAVLWTGKRSIVYVRHPDTDDPIFMLREIELGPKLGDSYIVLSGLEVGDDIVTQGTFAIDAAAQLEGKPSMMNTEGGVAPQVHNHGDTPSMKTESSSKHEDTSHATHDHEHGHH